MNTQVVLLLLLFNWRKILLYDTADILKLGLPDVVALLKLLLVDVVLLAMAELATY